MSKLKLIIFSILLLTSCNNETPIYHNYHETKNSLISWHDIFTQEENNYLVYFYSERCGHCNEIKQDVISFYLEDIYPMYFVCTDIEVVLGPKNSLVGIDNINDFYIFGTPFLLNLVDHKVDSYYGGASEVKEYISILKNNINKIE